MNYIKKLPSWQFSVQLHPIICKYIQNAAGSGLEPELMASKATVLPLDDPAIKINLLLFNHDFTFKSSMVK